MQVVACMPSSLKEIEKLEQNRKRERERFFLPPSAARASPRSTLRAWNHLRNRKNWLHTSYGLHILMASQQGQSYFIEYNTAHAPV